MKQSLYERVIKNIYCSPLLTIDDLSLLMLNDPMYWPGLPCWTWIGRNDRSKSYRVIRKTRFFARHIIKRHPHPIIEINKKRYSVSRLLSMRPTIEGSFNRMLSNTQRVIKACSGNLCVNPSHHYIVNLKNHIKTAQNSDDIDDMIDILWMIYEKDVNPIDLVELKNQNSQLDGYTNVEILEGLKREPYFDRWNLFIQREINDQQKEKIHNSKLYNSSV